MKTRELPEITTSAHEQTTSQQQHENSSGTRSTTDPVMSPLMKSIAAVYDKIDGINNFHCEYTEDDGIIFVTLSPIWDTIPPVSKPPSRTRKNDRLNQQVITTSIEVATRVKPKKQQAAKSSAQLSTKS